MNIIAKGFCASGKDGEVFCPGDSGGPAIWIDREDQNREYLIGIASAYSFCGRQLSNSRPPGIFVAIPGKIADWIQNKINA